jgi:hypothetical protein
MKQLLFVIAAALASLGALSQDEAVIIRGSTKIDRNMTSQQVIDSLNARFPNAHAVKYFKIPPDAVNKGWTVSREDNLGTNEAIDYYTVTFKREGFNYYALFQADGTLVRSKHEEKVDQLPDAVKFSIKALQEQHPGYKVVSKKYFRNISGSTDEEYFEVIAQKDQVKKSLYYKADGTLLEIKS